MDYNKLAEKAIKAKSKSLATFSKFRVGSAVLAKSGKVYLGANIEISSYSLTMCAERNAVFQAILAGERKFQAVVVASDLEGYCPPCGACRQVLLDLCGKDTDIILVDKKNKLQIHKLGDLIPHAFGEEDLKNHDGI